MAEKETKSCSEGCEEMTDNEVIKALEVCAYSDACLKECPFFNYKEDCTKRLTASALKIIKRHQSDVAPVRHGKWIYNPNGMDFNLGAWECSVCTQKNNNLPCNRNISPYICVGSKYCPNCGAKMDKTE